MEIKVGMRVMYLDTPDNSIYKYRPALATATGCIIGYCNSSVLVRWDRGGLCEYPQMNSAYYAPRRLIPLGRGGF